MNKDTQDAIRQVEQADDLLLNMSATMQFVGLGIENMANGEEVANMLAHFRNTIQDARALLDDARGAVLMMQRTA